MKAGGLLWCLLGCIMSTAEEPTVGNLGTVITSTWTCWVTFYAVSLSVSITFSVKQISGLYALRGLGGDNGKGAASHPALLPYQCKGAWISCWTVNQPDDRPNPSFTREQIPAGNQSDTFPMLGVVRIRLVLCWESWTQNHRVTKPFRIKKTFMITKSNHQSDTETHHKTMILSAMSTHVLNTSWDGDPTTAPGSPFQ